MHPRGGALAPRRSKADTLRIVQQLKHGILAGAIVSFGVLSALVAGHLPAARASQASPATSSGAGTTTTATATPASGGYFTQQSGGSSVGSSGSSSSSATPVTSSSVS